jgi:hypothetical protein
MATKFMTELMNEVILYGGLPMRRADVFALATEHMGDRAGRRFGADYFAFRPTAVDAEPWPLDEARELMK